MKFKAFLAIALASILFAFTSRRVEEIYNVDIQKSNIEWIAGKVTGEHRGVVKLEGGTLALEDNNLKSGNFTIDMKTMACTDLKGSSAQSLLGHLKGEDFFSIEKYPTATFALTKVSPITNNLVSITGNLTIKGITNSVTFPANIKKQKNSFSAAARDVKVDRTKYDIRYRSKSFFGDIGDKAIDDTFLLNISLVCRK
jgi:polyisoprenoid-binding protein YceI